MKLPFWPNPSGYRDIELGLTRVYQLLERLDNPHLKLPPTIHLAGTNGKGSTQAFLRGIFTEANLKFHSYTSPHLVNFNERILLQGQEISDEFLHEILSECKAAAEKSPAIKVTFFEGITVAAFLAFSRVPADVLLLEVGMGGRLDATNVLPKVLCSIITPIAFDHEEFLGNSLEKIAGEKCGIIKKNCAVICAKQEEEITKLIARKSQENQAEFIDAKKYRNRLEGCEIGLLGDHQIDNAATAYACILTQKKFSISEEEIKKGIAKTFWPARLQKISSGKFFENLPKNFELYLDGSHNPQGAATVREFLKSKKNDASSSQEALEILGDKSPRMTRVFVIFSMLKDKNCEEFLKIISEEIDELIAIEIPDEPKSRKAEEIFEISKNLKIKSQKAENFSDAFSKIKCDEDALILVCGSLYLAGSFLEINYLP